MQYRGLALDKVIAADGDSQDQFDEMFSDASVLDEYHTNFAVFRLVQSGEVYAVTHTIKFTGDEHLAYFIITLSREQADRHYDVAKAYEQENTETERISTDSPNEMPIAEQDGPTIYLTTSLDEAYKQFDQNIDEFNSNWSS